MIYLKIKKFIINCILFFNYSEELNNKKIDIMFEIIDKMYNI